MQLKKWMLTGWALLTFPLAIFAQKQNNSSQYDDAAHHWYNIGEKGKLVSPLPGQGRYEPQQTKEIAENILLYQKDNGGWPKNYDMRATLTPEQKDTLLHAKHLTNTTFDNRTTFSQIQTLAKAYTELNDTRYKDAAIKGLDFILAAQYANGGWPQFYPIQPKSYSRYITYNDDAMGGVMQLLKDIDDGQTVYNFIDEQRKAKLHTAYEKGLTCILQTQINDGTGLTAWCQQHDEVNLQPAWARKFEPPSICNGESVKLVLLLMSIKNPSPKIVDAVEHAIAWFKQSAINGIRVQKIDAPELKTPYTNSTHDKVVVADSAAPQIWTRYYELVTHKPVFCNRDSKLVYSLAEVDRERRDGYEWYTYAPQKALDKYEAWKQKLLKK